MEKKIDITSTVLEKGIDAARSFLGKLIMPAVEETGLLLKEGVALWKFKNQVRVLNKAKSYCEKNNISTKTINLKLLCPLLEFSGLEEDDYLQTKWANLLSNMVDSEQNLQNHVFPYILSQISRDEFMFLDEVYQAKLKHVASIKVEIDDFLSNKEKIKTELIKKLADLTAKVDSGDLKHFKDKIVTDFEIKRLETRVSDFRRKMIEPQPIPEHDLQPFEMGNLLRLGLIKEKQETFANSQSLEIPNDRDSSYLTVDFDIDVELETTYILTHLGELFLAACNDKNLHS